MFEKGGWQDDSEDEEGDKEDDDFDLEALRAETRRLEGDDEDDEQLKSYGTR